MVPEGRRGVAVATPRNMRVWFRALQRLNCPQAGEEVPKQQESELLEGGHIGGYVREPSTLLFGSLALNPRP